MVWVGIILGMVINLLLHMRKQKLQKIRSLVASVWQSWDLNPGNNSEQNQTGLLPSGNFHGVLCGGGG